MRLSGAPRNMTELLAGLIGALVGSLSTYWLAVGFETQKERRRRSAVASAALGEVYALTYSMDILRGEWPGFTVKVEFPTHVLDQVVEHLDLFSPATAYAIFDLRGSVRDLQQGLETLSSNPARPDKVKKEVQWLARIILNKTLAARTQLEREGGALPRQRYWPNTEAVDRHLQDVKGYLKDTRSEP